MNLQTVRWSLQHSLKRIIRVECREIIGMKDFFQHGKWGIPRDKRCLEVKSTACLHRTDLGSFVTIGENLKLKHANQSLAID